MNVGSVFSGVGLLDLGLARAGHDIRWHCEADEWRRGILSARWPDAVSLGDVREVNPDELPATDVLVGGPPCQPISQAGYRLGSSDERWMWPEFFRLLGGIRPRYAVMENPTGILNFGLDYVLGSLAEIGYDAEWSSFPASALGAAHRRDRTFILAYPNEVGCEGRVPGSSGKGPSTEQGKTGDVGASRVDQFFDWRVGDLGVGREWKARPPEPTLSRMDDGSPPVVDRLKRVAALGDAVVVPASEWIGRRLNQWEGEVA